MKNTIQILMVLLFLMGTLSHQAEAQKKGKAAKKAKTSKVLVKRNVESVKIVKMSGELNKVEVKFKRFGSASNQNIKDLLMSSNSGSLQRGDNYAEFLSVNNWPFEARISFNALRKTAQTNFSNVNPDMQQVQGYQPCEVEVQITEPGHWVVEINF